MNRNSFGFSTIAPRSQSVSDILRILYQRAATIGMVLVLAVTLAGLAQLAVAYPWVVVAALGWICFWISLFVFKKRVKELEYTRRYFGSDQREVETFIQATQISLMIEGKRELHLIPDSQSSILREEISRMAQNIIGLASTLRLEIQRRPVFESNDHELKQIIAQQWISLNTLRTCLLLDPIAEPVRKHAVIEKIMEEIHSLLPLLSDWSLFRDDQDATERLASDLADRTDSIYVEINELLESGEFEPETSWWSN